MKFMKVTFCLVLLLAVPLRAEIVDRIVAVVDGRVITWSAMLAEANYRAFRNGQEPVATLEGEAFRTIVSQMADQELLEKEKANSPFSPPVNGDRTALEELRKRFASPAQFEKELARYKLTETELARHLSRENAILEFVEYHLRPGARLSPGAVEAYFRETLLPQLRQRGEVNAPSLEQVNGSIEQILTEQEMNRLLDEWLQQLRSRAKIRMILVTSDK